MGFFDFVRDLFSGAGIIREQPDEQIYYRKIVKGGIYQDFGMRGQKDKLNEIQVWAYTFEIDQTPDRAEWLIRKISPESRYDDIQDEDIEAIPRSNRPIDIGSNWSDSWGYDDRQTVRFSEAQGAIYPDFEVGEE